MQTRPPQPPPQAQVQLDISQTSPVHCENPTCGNVTFEEITILRRISEIISPTGKSGIVPIPVFACNACGYVNDEFLPPALRMKRAGSVPQSSTMPQADGADKSDDERPTFTGPRLVTE